MHTLYGNLDSGNVYKVRLLFSLLGVPHRRIEVSQAAGDTSSPGFRAINPIGKIPTVRFSDGRILSESGAILFYLAQGTSYWPRDSWSQAEVLRWMFFEQYSHEPALAVHRYIVRFMSADQRDAHAARLPDLERRGAHALSVMNDALGSRTALVGDVITLADLALYPYTHSAPESGFDLGPYKSIRRWMARLESLPQWVGQYDETSAVPVERLCDSG